MLAEKLPSSQFVTIPVSQLKFGMYVAELDRPWLETPFLVQGFVLSDQDQLDLLCELCSQVSVDVRTMNRNSIIPAKSKSSDSLAVVGRKKYKNQRSVEKELKKARNIYLEYETTVAKFFDRFKANQTIDLKDIDDKVNDLVSSVVRNPDACILLHQMRKKSNYLHDHAIGMAIWSATLARQLGLPAEDMRTIATGAMLCDIGSLNIPDSLLNRSTKLTHSEYEYVKTHVERGVEMARQIDGMQAEAVDIIAHHHERYDGSGYPQGKSGTKIPLLARIVSIADCYDAVISKRPFAVARPPAEAARLLYSLRNRDFQEELVEEFIQAVGIYPVGTMVELSDGTTGVVIAEHKRRRLRPKIQILKDRHGELLDDRRYMDLVRTTHDDQGEPLDIVRTVDAESCGLAEDDIFL